MVLTSILDVDPCRGGTRTKGNDDFSFTVKPPENKIPEAMNFLETFLTD